MKLRNKKTGENYETTMPIVFNIKTSGGGEHTVSCGSMTELNEEWEDAPEEPTVGYIIDPMEEDYVSADDSGYEEADIERAKELGIWFETEEETKEAVKKLKAWQRLKELGTEVLGWETAGLPSPLDKWQTVNIRLNVRVDKKEPMELLDLLVGGKE